MVGGEGPYKGFTSPMLNLNDYAFKPLNGKKWKNPDIHSKIFFNAYKEICFNLEHL